jgi:hypothetical protein
MMSYGCAQLLSCPQIQAYESTIVLIATDQLSTRVSPVSRLLAAAEFQRLADVPPEIEWFVNFSNRSNEACLRLTLPRPFRHALIEPEP